jgi:hypothetical protein
LSLTLGIAGTTTVFSVMNGAMFRPLAGRDVGSHETYARSAAYCVLATGIARSSASRRH